MPSELENAMARFRRQLLQQERAAASQMVRAYGESWARIRVDILRVQAQLAAGDTTLWRIQQDARLQSVQAQIEAEIRRFAPYAAQSAIQLQQAAIDAAVRNAGQAIEAAGGPAVTMRFDKLNTGAVEAMVGFASDGSPLQTLFNDIAPDVAPRMTATLAKGIALGWGPRVTAREMRSAYGMGLSRALLISRTETLRSYREATSQVYQANADILEGWIWVCACDRRSCASCWAMHGSLHPLDARLDDHPNGRCAMAPKVRDRPNRIGATGAERFDLLSADDQRAVLGPGMYEAWKDGRVSLSPTGANSIVGQRNDAQWGTMRHARSLRDVVGAEDARGYSAKAAGKGAPAPVRAAPVAARVMGPAGEPMGKHFVLDAKNGAPLTPNLKNSITNAMSAIDSVHGDGPLPDLDVVKDSSIEGYGQYKCLVHEGHVSSIHIAMSPGQAHAGMTFVHEAGHFIDFEQLHMWDIDIDALSNPKGRFWDAISNSKAAQRFRELRDPDYLFSGADGKKYIPDEKMLNYLVSSEEMWARSYAQYVATKSSNPVLLEELREMQSKSSNGVYPDQWEDDDFAPIASAIDVLFQSLGWIK